MPNNIIDSNFPIFVFLYKTDVIVLYCDHMLNHYYVQMWQMLLPVIEYWQMLLPIC